MNKVIEKNVAEIIFIGVFLAILLSSCRSVQTQGEYHANLDCANCDEID